MTLDERLKIAAESYAGGCTCSQAVICAFCNDMGLDKVTAYKLMEGFGGGFGAKQEVCGAFCAATAILSFFASSGSMDGKSKGKTYKVIRRAAEIYEQEYGSIRCREILCGNPPKAFQCAMKVKDAVLLVHNVMTEENLNTTEVQYENFTGHI